ncbi:Uncharacterized protein Rs2_34782 [Raphanus sativus]|nr:Uncharacterized protein Rs2_34782 [Raphanus sativus]
MLTDTIIEAVSVFPLFGAGEARSSRSRDLLAHPLCFFLSLFLSNLFSLYCPLLNLLYFGVWRSNLSLQRRRVQSHMNPVLAVSLSTWLILLCSAAPDSSLVMSVNRVSGESPEESYTGAWSQLLMAGFDDVSPWRNRLSSPIVLSVPVEPPAAFYYSFKLTVMDPPTQISGCYAKSTGTKLLSRDSRKDLSQNSLKNHTDPSCSLRAISVSLGGIGLSPQTPLAVAHTNTCSISLSFLDFTNQWINSVFAKSSWLRYGNAGRGSVCLKSLLAPLESRVKLLSLFVGMKGKSSEDSHPWLLVTGAVNSETSNNVHQQQRSTLTRTSIISLPLVSQVLLKTEDYSPLATFLTTVAKQISSCQGHERSFSPILLFAGENLSTKTPLYKRYPSLGLKASECFRLHNRLISCVMVCLGPEDTTRIIPMRLEVVEHSTSRHTVTISKSEDFKGRSIFSTRFLASGSFDINLDILSNIAMFVSLSFTCFAFKFPKSTAHHMFDGAWIYVNL